MHLQGTLYKGAHIDKNFFRRVLLREAKQVCDQVAGAACLLTDFLGYSRLLAFGCLRGQQLGVAENGGKRIINLMGRSGDELSEGRELFFLYEMRLQPLQVFVALA